MNLAPLNLAKYVGTEYGKPYDCFGLVKAVRADLGLETPTLYDPNSTQLQFSQILDHKKSDLWVQRSSIHSGKLGDVITMSAVSHFPHHHLGVIISSTELIHLEPTTGATLISLARLGLSYPSYARWGTN